MKQSKFPAMLSIAFLFVLAINGIAGDNEIAKHELVSAGKKRSYYVFVPKSIEKSNPAAPLLVLLHGSGHDGRLLIEHWQKLAEREGIILAGPDAKNSATWSIPTDGPEFIHDLIEEIKLKHPVDAQRVYLFGHSAGAAFGLLISLLESDYFSATAVSAGALQQKSYRFFEQAERKIPVALFVGTEDPLFPLAFVRETRNAFAERNFAVELTEIPKLNHNYYSRSQEINEKAWEFLKKHRLDIVPKYKQYQFNSK